MRTGAGIAMERARRRHRPVSAPQRRTLAYLAGTADMEVPIVNDGRKASKVITFLDRYVREPTQLGLM
jgi:hypothetical protein